MDLVGGSTANGAVWPRFAPCSFPSYPARRALGKALVGKDSRNEKGWLAAFRCYERRARGRSFHPLQPDGHMHDTTFSQAAPLAADTVDTDAERQLDDLEDLDDDDCFEELGDLGIPDELEHLGGYSESTALEDPPPT